MTPETSAVALMLKWLGSPAVLSLVVAGVASVLLWWRQAFIRVFGVDVTIDLGDGCNNQRVYRVTVQNLEDLPMDDPLEIAVAASSGTLTSAVMYGPEYEGISAREALQRSGGYHRVTFTLPRGLRPLGSTTLELRTTPGTTMIIVKAKNARPIVVTPGAPAATTTGRALKGPLVGVLITLLSLGTASLLVSESPHPATFDGVILLAPALFGGLAVAIWGVGAWRACLQPEAPFMDGYQGWGPDTPHEVLFTTAKEGAKSTD